MVVHRWRDDQGPVGRDKKTGPNPTDRAKQGAKRSLLTEASGIPVGLAIDGANRHDMKLVRATEAGLVVGSPITHSRMANKQRGKLQVVQGYRAAILPLDPTEIGSKGPVPESLWKQWTG